LLKINCQGASFQAQISKTRAWNSHFSGGNQQNHHHILKTFKPPSLIKPHQKYYEKPHHVSEIELFAKQLNESGLASS